MADQTPQSYANHKRIVPGFHYVTFALLLIPTIWWVYRSIRAFSVDHLMLFAMGAGAVMLLLYTRSFATKNQDRIIRLEERTRLEELLPPELVPRIGELTTAQCVAIRFAADAEVEALVRAVLHEGITDREAIKGRVRSWRADYQRV